MTNACMHRYSQKHLFDGRHLPIDIRKIIDILCLLQWIPGGGGSCRQHLRICDYPQPLQPQSNWVFTQFINFEESTEIYVNTSYQYFSCVHSAHRGCSTLQTTLYRYETNGEVDNSARVNPANYLPNEVQVLSLPANQVSETKTTTFLSSATARGFYLGLLDTGTCGSIERITAYCRGEYAVRCVMALHNFSKELLRNECLVSVRVSQPRMKKEVTY